MPTTMNLYERMGGADAVKATITLMYEKVLSDPLLMPFFQNVNVDHIRTHHTAFVTMAFGWPTHYTVMSLRKAHQHLAAHGLSDAHFDKMAQHLISAMERLSVPPGFIEEAVHIVETTRSSILNR